MISFPTEFSASPDQAQSFPFWLALLCPSKQGMTVPVCVPAGMGKMHGEFYLERFSEPQW